MPDPTSLDLLRAVLDPFRLSVLGAAATGPVDVAAFSDRTGVAYRDIVRAIGDLRASGLIEDDGSLSKEALRTIARSLPHGPGPGDESVKGPWTDDEARVLGRFFAGGKLTEIPVNASKRRLVVEKIALEFEPGVRYSEREVNLTIQMFHGDYAAIRRYMVDESFMDRADGAYWRTGGRYGPPGDAGRTQQDAPLPVATDRADVVLRPYNLGMVDSLVAAADDDRISIYMGDSFPNPYTTDDAETWVDTATADTPPYHYAIYVGASLSGGVGAFLHTGERTGSAEIGWWLNPRYWGNGVTTAAVGAFVDEMFAGRGLERLSAEVREPNRASARVAQKAGMSLEGVSRSMYVRDGVRMDGLRFAITRQDWAQI